MVPTLPGATALNGARIIFGRPGIRDPNTTTMDHMLRTLYVMLDVVNAETECLSVQGVNVVIDATNLSFAHTAQMTPSVMKKASTIFQVFHF